MNLLYPLSVAGMNHPSRIKEYYYNHASVIHNPQV